MKPVSTVSSTLKLLAIIAIMTLMASSLYAQKIKTKTLTFTDNSEVFLLREIGGIIVESNDSIRVNMVMPKDARAKEYQSVNILVGDLIKMANGKKVTSLSMLEGLYDSLAIGEVLKLGIIRDKRMVIGKLTKGDPEKLPGKMIMITDSGGGGTLETSLIDAGLLLNKIDGVFIVEGIIDNMLLKFEGHTPRVDDVLLKIQGQKIKSSEQIAEIMQKIKDGENVDLILSRDGKEISATFVKPKSEDKALGKKIKIKR